MESLARHWPGLVPRYEALYARPYLPMRETEPIKHEVAALRRRLDIADRRQRPLEPPPEPEQLPLAM